MPVRTHIQCLVHVEVPAMGCRLSGNRRRMSLEIQELQVISSLIPFVAIVVHTRAWLRFELGICGESLRCTKMKVIREFVL